MLLGCVFEFNIKKKYLEIQQLLECLKLRSWQSQGLIRCMQHLHILRVVSMLDE